MVERDEVEVEQASTWLQTAMVDGMQPFLPRVPVVVDKPEPADTWE